MEERFVQTAATERPISGAEQPPGSPGPAHLADPRALMILTTEHWSLLTARSLVYNEAFARTGMFLTFLTGTLVALGFVSQGSGYGPEFLLVATALLGFDLFIGLTTLGRITAAGNEEFQALQGMNRLRHAYLEMVPGLEPYFSTSPHDDLMGVLAIYGATPERPSLLGNLAHGLTTAPGMVATICAVVGGGFAASLALLIGATTTLAIVAGLVAFTFLFVGLWVAAIRAFQGIGRRIEVRFPTPPPTAGGGPSR